MANLNNPSSILEIIDTINGKQDTLISGTTIKTINNESLLGSGNITISGGGGTATDVQINGTSITNQGVANIITNTAYDASSNKIATMSDISTKANLTGGNTFNGNQTLEDTSSGHITVLPPELQFKNENGTLGFYLDNSANKVKMNNNFANEPTSNLPFIDGQWVNLSTPIDIWDNSAATTVTNIPITFLPNDNYSYEIYCRCVITKSTSTTGSDSFSATDAVTTYENFVVCYSSSSVQGRASAFMTFIIDSNRVMPSITHHTKSSSAEITAVRYRRLGTNS